MSIFENLNDREIVCMCDREGSNAAYTVARAVSSESFYPQEVMLAQFSLYVDRSGTYNDSLDTHLLGLLIKTSTYRYLKNYIH